LPAFSSIQRKNTVEPFPLALFPLRVDKITLSENFYRPLFIFEDSKMKSVTEKGFPASLHYAVTRGKKRGTSVFDSRS
jgi:hypothetical protein